ncbi:MAG: DNA polymerase I [Patescibacteria group bacterium]|jgi:DNA polymerase-1
MAVKKEKLIIIDGNALIHRSFHALPTTMKTKSGEITNAVYGFTTVLIKALKEFKPEYIVLTLDRKEKTFRHEEFTEYKAKRVKAPDELYEQIPRIKDIARAFNIPIFEKAGYEADDLIGTIASLVKSQKSKVKSNIENIIVTGDMDTLQLVDGQTKVYTMSRGLSESLLYDTDMVRKRFDGLAPEQVIDYKALRGDPSDNIPGVRGIGEKGAIELLKEFKTIENLYDHITRNTKRITTNVKPRILELLKAHKQDAFMSKKLATIKCDVAIDFEIKEARARDFDINAVTKVFNELEFKSLLPRLQELNKKLQPANKTSDNEQNKFDYVKNNFNYNLIDTEDKLKKFLTELKKQKIFAYDTETSNFNPLEATLLGVSFSWKKGGAYYIEIKSRKSKVESQGSLFDNKTEKKNSSGINPDFVIKNLKPIFEDKKINKIAHNAKFDIEVMMSNGIKPEGVNFDTMVASYLLNPGSRQHGLDLVTFKYLNYTKISKDDLLGTGRNKIKFAEVPIERLYLYSCEDADFTWQLYEKLSQELEEKKLDKLFNEIEIPTLHALVDMERVGIKLNVSYLANLQKIFQKEINSLTKKIHKIAGETFNINSTQQLQKILFDKLDVPTDLIKKTKTGYSTGADELQKLKGQHEIIDLISKYRELTKLQNTYIEALPKLVSKTDKRLHTSYQQTVTATGRLSSTDPNLQNIPVRTEEGRKIRKAFIAKPGYKLVAADYSQIELRLAAAMSGDKIMLQAFKNNEDIHAATAAAINDVKLKDVTKEMRRAAKAVNFGILYGQGPFGLSQTASIPQWQAKEFIDKYFKKFSGVKKWINDNIKKAEKAEMSETLFGRIRHMPEINSSNLQIKKGAERIAMNTPLQGTAADIMKIAMVKTQQELEKFSNNANILLQVHDELIIEVKNDLVEKIAKLVKKTMEDIIKLKVPIVVDISVGDNWEEMSPVISSKS